MALESRLAWLFHCDLHCALWHSGGLEPAFRAELIAHWFPTAACPRGAGVKPLEVVPLGSGLWPP